MKTYKWILKVKNSNQYLNNTWNKTTRQAYARIFNSRAAAREEKNKQEKVVKVSVLI